MKTILITGANGSLGLPVVSYFLKRNYRVVGLISPRGRMEEKENLRVFQADLTNESDSATVFENIYRQYNSIEAALLLAGGFSMGNINNSGLADLEKMLSLNFYTAYNVIRILFPRMQQKGFGRIVMVGARPALEQHSGKDSLGYTLAKSLLLKLADTLNTEGAATNVVCSIVAPSIIDTPVNRAAMPAGEFNQWVKPGDLAAAMEFLCSEKADSWMDPVIKFYGKA
jgi:NAD(P)-dependent dehydrogenase (short-subunit alcohol dehydrogenase family)